jgi:hypothetical protein
MYGQHTQPRHLRRRQYVNYGSRGSTLVVPLVPRGRMKTRRNTTIGHSGKTQRTALRRASIRPLAGTSDTASELGIGLLLGRGQCGMQLEA